MATIRKHGNKWQVQVRRAGSPTVSRSFTLKADAEVWARQTEIQADKRAIPADARVLDRTTVTELMQRYLDTIIPQIRDLCVVTNGAFNPVPGQGRHQISVVGFPTKE